MSDGPVATQLERIENALMTLLKGQALHERLIVLLENNAKAIEQGQDKLMQSHAAVSVSQSETDKLMAKGLNAIADRLERLQSDFDQWPHWRNGIEKKLEGLELGSSSDWLQTRTLLDITNRRLKNLERGRKRKKRSKR